MFQFETDWIQLPDYSACAKCLRFGPCADGSSVCLRYDGIPEIGLNIHPLLLGGGTPMFVPMARRVDLELIEARAIAKDCVQVR